MLYGVSCGNHFGFAHIYITHRKTCECIFFLLLLFRSTIYLTIFIRVPSSISFIQRCWARFSTCTNGPPYTVDVHVCDCIFITGHTACLHTPVKRAIFLYSSDCCRLFEKDIVFITVFFSIHFFLVLWCTSMGARWFGYGCGRCMGHGNHVVVWLGSSAGAM